MSKEFIPYELAVKLKELGFDENCFGRFYTKPKCKMFSVDEKGRHYQIKNTPKKLYAVGEYFVLNDDNAIIAPTFSQAFRWFREKYNILATIYSNASGYLYEWHDAVGGTHRGWSEYEGPNDGGVWDTYEEAELACLTKLIEIVQGGQDNE